MELRTGFGSMPRKTKNNGDVTHMNARDFLRSVGKCFITAQLLLLLVSSSAKSANIYSAAATSSRNAFHYSCCLTP